MPEQTRRRLLGAGAVLLGSAALGLQEARPAGAVGAPRSDADLDALAYGAHQLVLVTARTHRSTSGRLSTWARREDRTWAQRTAPEHAWLGVTGVAEPRDKREGDGRTPAGSYALPYAFGTRPDPGLAVRYRRITGPWDVWVDDSTDPHYNQWVDTRRVAARSSESLPSYEYAAVIDYNTHPVVRGKGSAIFLHQSRGRPTVGCVSLPIPRLLRVLRWLDPAAAPRIAVTVG